VKDLILSIDGLDLRSYASLKPMEQLDRLERDRVSLTDYEIAKRKADTFLRTQSQKKTEKPS